MRVNLEYKLLKNMFGKNFFDFPMARQRLYGTGLRVLVSIVISAVPYEKAAASLQFAN